MCFYFRRKHMNTHTMTADHFRAILESANESPKLDNEASGYADSVNQVAADVNNRPESARPVRYIVHCEGDPYLLNKRFSILNLAVKAADRFVKTRLTKNGCGDGVIIDTWADRVVLVLGHLQEFDELGHSGPLTGILELPNGVEERRMIEIATAWNQPDAAEMNLPGIWH
jgi:hypothetical protein